MWSFIPKINLRISASSWIYYKNISRLTVTRMSNPQTPTRGSIQNIIYLKNYQIFYLKIKLPWTETFYYKSYVVCNYTESTLTSPKVAYSFFE